MSGWKTRVRRGDLTPFWPLSSNTDNMVVVAGEHGGKSSSIPFNYRKFNFNVLQFDSGSEVSDKKWQLFKIVTTCPYILCRLQHFALKFKSQSLLHWSPSLLTTLDVFQCRS